MMYNIDLFKTSDGKQGNATFGRKEDNADFPLGILPLVREFVAQDKCQAVLRKHNAKLIPSWKNKHGAIQITKFSDIHHRGNVVCLKMRTTKNVDIEKHGVRVFTRTDYQNYLMICLEHNCENMKTAYLQSMAIAEALIEVGAEGRELWKQLARNLPERMKDLEKENDFTDEI